MKNKERIELLEKRVQALEDGTIQIDQFVTDKNGNGIVTHRDGGYTVYPNMDISKAYVVPNANTNPNLITDWLEKNGNPEIEAKVKSDLALEEVKRQVTELLKNTDLPDWAEYVSVDIDGEVYCHNEKPISSNENWDTDKERWLSYIPLNGADWTKCCWKISDLLGDVKKNFTTELDWENVLTKDDAMIIYPAMMGIDTTKYLITHLNRKIHTRIKPLFERIAELEAEKPNTIEVPFRVDSDGDVIFPNEWTSFYKHCRQNNIDQTKIKRILLKMKSEIEE